MKCYPQHGSARSNQGFKFLWFPILSLIDHPVEFRKDKGIKADLKIEDLLVARSYRSNLFKLAVSLRELHRFCREYADAASDSDSSRLAQYAQESYETVPLYVDLIFVYLRRLADRLAEGSRPILFGKYSV